MTPRSTTAYGRKIIESPFYYLYFQQTPASLPTSFLFHWLPSSIIYVGDVAASNQSETSQDGSPIVLFGPLGNWLDRVWCPLTRSLYERTSQYLPSAAKVGSFPPPTPEPLAHFTGIPEVNSFVPKNLVCGHITLSWNRASTISGGCSLTAISLLTKLTAPYSNQYRHPHAGITQILILIWLTSVGEHWAKFAFKNAVSSTCLEMRQNSWSFLRSLP